MFYENMRATAQTAIECLSRRNKGHKVLTYTMSEMIVKNTTMNSTRTNYKYLSQTMTLPDYQ